VTEPTAPAEGWYPDPAGGGGLRWWTGVTWTHETRAADTATWAPVTPEPAANDVPGTDPSSPRRRTTLVVVVAAMLALVLVVVGVATLLTSLSSRSRLDMGAVQSEIAAQLSDRTGQPTTVECPASIEIAAGTTFVCAATGADGTATTVTVHQDDDQGNLSFGVEP
jgi:hypothetical protein